MLKLVARIVIGRSNISAFDFLLNRLLFLHRAYRVSNAGFRNRMQERDETQIGTKQEGISRRDCTVGR